MNVVNESGVLKGVEHNHWEHRHQHNYSLYFSSFWDYDLHPRRLLRPDRRHSGSILNCLGLQVIVEDLCADINHGVRSR